LKKFAVFSCNSSASVLGSAFAWIIVRTSLAMKLLLRVLPLCAVALVCQCGVPQPPRCTSVPLASRTSAPTLVNRAATAWDILGDPHREAEWPAARLSYNTAVARLFDQLRCRTGALEDRAADLGTRLAVTDTDGLDPAALDALIPASRISTRGFRKRQLVGGIGVPVVGWKVTAPVAVRRAPFEVPTGRALTLNATLDFSSPSLPAWRFVNRWNHNDIRVENVRHPLAADWTATNAFYWRMATLDDLTVLNVLLPERFMEETGLYFLEPYDPEKIPVVMVHGLKSSPHAFKHIINHLAAEPWFRQRYQIWLFNYPTGNPWLYSSMRFREFMNSAASFARTQGHDRNLNRMVILTHSMGGLITRSSVTDPGATLYSAHFNVPLDHLAVSPGARQLIADATLYRPLTEPNRVVFMAVPHAGSPIANLRLSMWMSDFIKLPKRLTVDLFDATLRSVGGAVMEVSGKPRLPTSISTLSPSSRGIVALNSLPLPDRISFHSIHGNITRRPDSRGSDGVVPYWSSHVPGVVSEQSIRYHHGVTDCPAAALEVSRILKLHLEAAR
jgi:hypothetical protein